MLYNIHKNSFESEKERNLYAKFFAGFYFNELIQGYEDRKIRLNEYLSESINQKFNLSTPHASFDNHAYLLSENSDSGEFADVAIHDSESKIFICIEAKFLSNWSEKTDLKNNLKRIEVLKKEYPRYTFLFFLLVSKIKWGTLKMMEKHPHSNYRKYKEKYSDIVGILFWEDLLKFCDNEEVVSYMTERLNLVNAPKGDRKANIV